VPKPLYNSSTENRRGRKTGKIAAQNEAGYYRFEVFKANSQRDEGGEKSVRELDDTCRDNHDANLLAR
jgi:hypothetical protein